MPPTQSLKESIESVLIRPINRRTHAFVFTAAILGCALLALLDAPRKLGAVLTLSCLCGLIAVQSAVIRLLFRFRRSPSRRESNSGKVPPAGEATGHLIIRDVAVAVGLSLIAWLSPVIVEFGSHVRLQYSTKVGERRVVPLADRGQVTLNTDSNMELLITDHAVQASLIKGEALFSMVHPSARPFTLLADGLVVKDVGTVFEVKYRTSGGIAVAVVRGSVILSASQTDARRPMPFAPVVLQEGQIAIHEDSTLEVKPPDLLEVERQIMWSRSRLTFAHATLAEIVAELNRYNPIQVIIEDPTLADRQLTVALDSTNPEDFVNVLRKHFRPLTLSTRRVGNTILIGLEQEPNSDKAN